VLENAGNKSDFRYPMGVNCLVSDLLFHRQQSGNRFVRRSNRPLVRTSYQNRKERKSKRKKEKKEERETKRRKKDNV
jgi:hypothetical protein